MTESWLIVFLNFFITFPPFFCDLSSHTVIQKLWQASRITQALQKFKTSLFFKYTAPIWSGFFRIVTVLCSKLENQGLARTLVLSSGRSLNLSFTVIESQLNKQTNKQKKHVSIVKWHNSEWCDCLGYTSFAQCGFTRIQNVEEDFCNLLVYFSAFNLKTWL